MGYLNLETILLTGTNQIKKKSNLSGQKKEKVEKLFQMTSEHGMHALEFYFPKLSKKLEKRKIKMRH